MTEPRIAIVCGSPNDWPVMEPAKQILNDFEIVFEEKTSSAHRTPEATRRWARSLEERGVQVVIAGAGYAAHLAGALAAHTTLPVIGVPIDSSPLAGLDSLLSTVMMPSGIPVATMAIGKAGAKNAAIFAAEILALSDERVHERVKAFRQRFNDQ